MSDHTPDTDRSAASHRSTSDLFFCLAHTNRRLALSRLLNADRALSVDDLVTYLESRTVSVDEPDASSESERQRLTVELRSAHLPMLADYGLIEYDGQSVVATAAAERTEKFIHMAAQDEHLRLARSE